MLDRELQKKGNIELIDIRRLFQKTQIYIILILFLLLIINQFYDSL
jgi:hypothetical protein